MTNSGFARLRWERRRVLLMHRSVSAVARDLGRGVEIDTVREGMNQSLERDEPVNVTHDEPKSGLSQPHKR
jgi:hypothetical protein